MKKYFLAGLAVVFLLAVGLISYGAYLNYHDENQITERLAQQVLPLAGEKAKIRDIRPRLEIAPVHLSSGQMADAVALTKGQIVEVKVKKNDRVRMGDVLFVVHMPELSSRLKQADSSVFKAETELLRTRNTYNRYAKLREEEAVSAEKYDETESAYHAAQASLDAAIAARDELLVQQEEQQVLAPIDGEVIKLYHPMGTYISAGTPLALIGNFEQLHFYTSVDEKEASYLAFGQEAVVSFSYEDFEKVYGTEYSADNRGREENIIARVIEISPDLSEPAAIRKVLWEIDNRAGLLEPKTYGSHGSVSLTFLDSRRSLSVPVSAVIGSSQAAVFVFRDDGTLERRRVKTGLNDGTYVEILSGLEEGETVVTSVPQGVKENMKVSPILISGD